jgi:hypothetical protein
MGIILVGTARLQSSKMTRMMTPRLIAFSGFGHTIQKAGPISGTMAFVIPARGKPALTLKSGRFAWRGAGAFK